MKKHMTAKKIAMLSVLGIALFANTSLFADNSGWTAPQNPVAKLYPQGVGKKSNLVSTKVIYTHTSTPGEWTAPQNPVAKLYPQGVGKKGNLVSTKVSYTHTNSAGAWMAPENILAKLYPQVIGEKI